LIETKESSAGRTAWITGGTRGIGYGIALSLAEHGFNLAINGIRPAAEVKNLEPLREKYGIDLLYCQGNIGDAADRQDMFDRFIDHFGSIEVLVNNAGVAPKNRLDLLEVTEEEYDYVMDINLKGTFFLSQMVVNHMLKHSPRKTNTPFRCIINISSISATVASVNRPQYCLSKAGMSMLTQLLAVRLGDHSIPVYEVRPGIIKTDMTAAVTSKYDTLIKDGLCVTSRWGTPDDVGRAVGALVRGDLPYSTGQVILVDGGLTIQKL